MVFNISDDEEGQYLTLACIKCNIIQFFDLFRPASNLQAKTLMKFLKVTFHLTNNLEKLFHLVFIN